MNEEKFKLALLAPIDKNGVTIKLTVDIENSQTLSIKHYPEFIWFLFGTIGSLVGFFISFLTGSLAWAFYCVVILVIVLYNAFYARAFTCVIDKKTSVIKYHSSGVLMTSFDEHKSNYKIAQIKRLEIQRHVKGGRWAWADNFQIFLLLEKDQRIPLSPSSLDFGECQEFAEQIHNFIGKEIPMKALG